MSPTPLSEQMKAVVAYVAPLMKERRFKKQRHCFNRATDDGLVHVLAFQMARYEPIPPNIDREAYIESRRRIFGPSFYGTFTVPLGVFIPEVDEAKRRTSARRSGSFRIHPLLQLSDPGEPR